MEHLIKVYIDTFVENSIKTTHMGLDNKENRKKSRRQAKSNVKDWLNQDVIYQNVKGSKAIHIACSMGHNDSIISL